MASLGGAGHLRSRAAYGAEALKARLWEPRVARRARLVTAASEDDAGLLQSWGTRPLLLPHGSDPGCSGPSPADGPVTFVASFGYWPNHHAARFLLDEVWPRVKTAEPGMRLRLVGRQADQIGVRGTAGTADAAGTGAAPVEIASDPDDVEAFYREASVVVAPVRIGGGAQVKVTQALARGRLVVATPFSARTAPPGAGDGFVVGATAAELAACIHWLWRDLTERRRRERVLVENRPVRTWDQNCAPLVDALAEAVFSA